jgi:hypothetical protein
VSGGDDRISSLSDTTRTPMVPLPHSRILGGGRANELAALADHDDIIGGENAQGGDGITVAFAGS